MVYGNGELVLDLSLFQPWEIAARLDVMLAYPNISKARAEKLIGSMCADQIRTTLEEFPELRERLLARYPCYNPFTNRTERRQITKRREAALFAGEIILALITQEHFPELVGKAPVSIDQRMKLHWPMKEGEEEAAYLERLHSLERRQIRARYPIAHFAAALQNLAQEKFSKGEVGSYNYQDLDFLRQWVRRAVALEEYIRNTHALAGAASKLIPVRWIEPEQLSDPSSTS